MLYKQSVFVFLFLLLGVQVVLAQENHTVGLISYTPWRSFDGYNLLYPERQPTVYLLDNCGQIVHRWEDEEEFIPGKVAYLRPDGTLVKTKLRKNVTGAGIQGGGQGAYVEIRSWDNELLWQFEQNDSTARLHHDITPMPNGNILMISWEYYSQEEALAVGRDSSKLTQGRLWPDYILEVNPALDSVVWEWHIMDHVIQDYDANKLNYGVVGEHPELIDLNWDTNEGRADWTHVNSIDYNEGLDQILISVPRFNEFWIIDHSTTTAEAAGHEGGRSGRGGDLLFRWGNPATYRHGDAFDQKLFFQHDVHWVDDFVEEDFPYYGRIALFNNRVDEHYSNAGILSVDFDTLMQTYDWSVPEDFDEVFIHPQPEMMLSGIMSGIQLLPNGNVLICVARPGYIFEMTPDNQIVWEYKTPFSDGQPVEQGTVLSTSDNVTFLLQRYPADYSAFDGRDLTSQGYIEINADEDYCALVLENNETGDARNISIYPNPVTTVLKIEGDFAKSRRLSIVDVFGTTQIEYQTTDARVATIDVSRLHPGLYFLMQDRWFLSRFVVVR